MRLALVLYKYFPYGGMQRDFLGIAAALQQRGHHCRVYCLQWQGDVPPGIDLRRVAVRAMTRHGRGKRFLHKVRADLAVDPVDGVIGFNKMPGLDIYFAADPCYLDRALNSRGWLYRLGGRFRHFAAFEKAVFGPDSATRILLISETEQARFQHHYQTPEWRMSLLPPGVSPDRRAGPDAPARRAVARAALDVDSDELLLLFLGSGFVTKGLDRAIRALAATAAAQGGSRPRLLVVGQDKPRGFKRMAGRLGVGDAVKFLGGRNDVPELLLAADLLIHPARAEAGGIALLEALVAGLPVVTTDVCGYAHHIERARAGIVLNSPFRQEDLDLAVQRNLDGVYRAQCRHKALDYADETDLYSMHASGAGLIEDFIREKSGCSSG